MAQKLSNPTSLACLLTLTVLALGPSAVQAGGGAVQNPNFNPRPAAVVLDFSDPDARFVEHGGPQATSFSDLNKFIRPDPAPPSAAALANRPGLPEGMVQVGGMIVPEEMLEGAAMVADVERSLAASPRPAHGGPDISEICAFPEEVPPGIYDYDPRPGGETPRFHTVFLNYNGGVLSSGGENSAENISGIARTGHPYPPYGGGETKAIAVAQAIQNDFSDYAVRVVYLERPEKTLPYTMVMIGGQYSDTTAGPSGGVAPLDCEDFGQRNVCYAFQNASSATSTANVASQEIGHTLGLGHTSASDSFMAAGYASTQSGDLGLNNSCANTIQVAGQSASCTGVNRCHCGVPDQQHDVNTLFATFSPVGVDMVEPTIDILAPADGAVFDEGDEILVEFEPWDDVGGYGWKLLLENENGELLADQVDYDRALEFKLVGLPAGTYTISGQIQDHADHVVTTSITVTISGEQAESDTDTSTSDTTGGAGESDTETATDTAQTGAESQTGGADAGDTETGMETADSGPSGGTGSDSDSAGALDESTDGCGCRTSAPSAPAGLALLALLGLLRRRRR